MVEQLQQENTVPSSHNHAAWLWYSHVYKCWFYKQGLDSCSDSLPRSYQPIVGSLKWFGENTYHDLSPIQEIQYWALPDHTCSSHCFMRGGIYKICTPNFVTAEQSSDPTKKSQNGILKYAPYQKILSKNSSFIREYLFQCGRASWWNPFYPCACHDEVILWLVSCLHQNCCHEFIDEDKSDKISVMNMVRLPMQGH